MRSTRLALAVTALSAALTLTLAGCSDDKEDETPDADPTAATESSKDIDHGCEVEVKAVGSVRASWKGEARATEVADTGQTVYQARHKNDWIAVYSETDEAPAQALVTVKGVTYTATGKGIDVEPDGSGATVKAETSTGTGKGPRISAAFTCS